MIKMQDFLGQWQQGFVQKCQKNFTTKEGELRNETGVASNSESIRVGAACAWMA